MDWDPLTRMLQLIDVVSSPLVRKFRLNGAALRDALPCADSSGLKDRNCGNLGPDGIPDILPARMAVTELQPPGQVPGAKSRMRATFPTKNEVGAARAHFQEYRDPSRGRICLNMTYP